MPIITATQVTLYSNISASAATITASGLIPLVQERINWITNNQFTTDIDIQALLTFSTTDQTITVSGNDWESFGFAAADEIYVYHSYRNDGYYTVSSINGSVLTITSSASIVAEISGRSIMVSMVKWPTDVVQVAALMVEYDYDMRKERSPGVTSVKLGPWSESYSRDANGQFGYPEDIVSPLYAHRIVRLM